MLVIIKKSQGSLFDAPVHVAASVRKDGTVVDAHTRIQKVALHQAPKDRLHKLFDKHGGIRHLSGMLAGLPDGQRQNLIQEFARIDGKRSMAEVAALLQPSAPAPDFGSPHGDDLFSTAPPRTPEPPPPTPDVEVTPEKTTVALDTEAHPAINSEGAPPPAPPRTQPTTDKEAAACMRADLDALGIKARVDVAPGGGSVRVFVTHPGAKFSDADQESIKNAARDYGLTGSRGHPLATEATNPYSFSLYLSAVAPAKAEKPAAIKKKTVAESLGIKRRRVKDGFDGTHTELTMPDGSVRRIQRLNATESMGLPGWHDADKTMGENGYLDDTEEGAIKRVAAQATPTPPVALKPYDSTGPFGVQAGTSKPERRAINAAVIAALDAEDPDKALLRQYSGNGGCGDSLNEYYTDPDVARAMWTTLARLGVDHGSALEPSCATGVFMHTAPPGIRVTGVELDPISAKVAHILHGERHEVATASLERFATSDDRQFDVVVGNPPYGPRGYLAKDDKVNISTCEQYFTDTALDKCKPGGIVALVVPTGIMDSSSARAFRERLLCKAQFLGAQRMPNTAFEHSHTEVTTDVIYFRKRPDDIAGALSTLDRPTLKSLGIDDDEFVSGSYFTGRGAGNVLGKMTDGWRAKAGMGHDITVEGSMQDVPQALAAFEPDSKGTSATEMTMADILDAIPDEAGKKKALSAAAIRPYDGVGRAGDTKTVDGVDYVLQGDPLRWHRVDEFMAAEAIADAATVAADIDALMTGKPADRMKVEADVRAYVAKHGIPAANADLMTAAAVDKTLYRLIGAVNRKGDLSDVVTGRAASNIAGTLDTVAQTMALEKTEGFTAADLAERLGKPVEDVEEQLIADNRYAYAGDGKWTTMPVYLTGMLWPKLDAARAGDVPAALADKVKAQADRLEAVIDPKTLDNVDLQLNSAFIPLHVLDAYFNWRQFDGPSANDWTKKQSPVSISFDAGIYKIAGGNTYGELKMVDKYLNRTGVKKDDKETLDALNENFKDWLCSSPYRDSVEDLYNRTFRGFEAPEYSNDPIEVPGLNPEKDVRDWRWSSLRRSLATGKGIIADDVGLGKTLGGLLLARMSKIQGSAKKPIIVVPKSVLANWYAEAEEWFPGAKVLTIGSNFARDKNGELVGRDDSAAERKRKYHDMTQNDYDFIIISEPSFEELDLDPTTKEKYYSDDFWVQRGDSMGNAGDKRRKAIRENYEQYLAQREFSDKTDSIFFNDLGVDMLIADEMHHQKNLYAAKSRFGESPKFLGGQGLSNRALDFNLKTRYIRENNGGKNVHGLTATPTKNSPLEIYSMLSHIAPEAFERIAIRNSEEFLDRFCEFTEDKVLSTSGVIEDALVVSGFKNLDELREIMSQYIDRRTAADVGLELPERQDLMHVVDMTAAQQAVYADLRDLAEKSSGKKDATGDSHIFSIMDKMNKAALDLSLLGAEHAGASSPKYAALAKQCAAGVKDGGQIVFSEYVDSHDKIVSALVDSGIDRKRIGIINAQVAGSAVKRQNIADAFNAGKLDVVIGNCVMAEGMNLQKKTTDIHALDIPWEPATVQQRNGRGLRQGNKNKSIRIHTYLSKGSFDGYRYQAVAAKKDWQDLLWNGGDRVENLAREGNLSLDDMRIMLAADPEAARKAFEGDKAAAMQRHESGERVEANKVFVKFQEMSRNYGGLKNKDTASGQRLRRTMESYKTALFNNKFFTAKDALNKSGDVLIQPRTGIALQPGVGLSFADGKRVITGINSRDGTVSMRRYANTAGGGSITVPLDELNDGEHFAFNEAEESAEVAKHFAASMEEGAKNIKAWKDVKALPSAVLAGNYDAIQKQMKDGAKDYSFTFPHGDVPMVDKATGDLKMAASYEHTKLHDTHDYLLPTDDSKEKIVQAWMNSERGKVFSHEYLTSRKGSRAVETKKAKFPDASPMERTRNPWASALRSAHPETDSSDGYGNHAPRSIRKRFEADQLERVRRAPDFKSALREAFPLIKTPDSGYVSIDETPAWDPKALALLWAKARKEGVLASKFDDHLPKTTGSYAASVHDRYAYHRPGYTAEDTSVHGTLRDIAHNSNHRMLSASMEVGAANRGLVDKRLAMNRLNTTHDVIREPGKQARLSYDPGVLRSMLTMAEGMGVADKPVREAGLGPGGLLGAGSAADITVRQAIEQEMKGAAS
jgi:superfamily II DNA or RNA helicase/predicted RNA methylase